MPVALHQTSQMRGEARIGSMIDYRTSRTSYWADDGAFCRVGDGYDRA